MKTTLLIDGDIIAYQQAAQAEVPIEWAEDFWTLHADAREAKDRIDHWLKTVQETLGADEVKVCVSDGQNFRKELNPTYKAHRTKTRKPMILGELKEHLIYHHKARLEPRLEADDIISILATSSPGDEKRVMVSIDKDFNTVPGWHYNWNKPELGVTEVSLLQADWYFMSQTLTGDTTDGYPGCKGVGPVAAQKILGEANKTIQELWSRVLAAYAKAGFGEEEALMQARMARLLRRGDYSTKTKRITLWNPSPSISN